MTAFIARPFRAETDLSGLVALHNAVDAAEGREPTLTIQQMRRATDSPKLHRWVIDAPDGAGELAGYGVLFHQTPDRCYGDVRVGLAWRRRGLGRLLVDQLVTKAAELGTRYLAIDVDHTNQEALRFLLSQGFRYRGDTWALVAPAGRELPPPVWPDGYTVRAYAEVNDLPLYVALKNHTFGDLWGHWENTPGLVDEAQVAANLGRFDSRGSFLVFDPAGAAVGQCRTLPAKGDGSGDTPHILDQPGVVPAHRAAGLHAPLALTAAHWLRAQEARPIRLESWGDPAATIAIYEALGFTLEEHEVSYVRELPVGATS